MDTVDNLSSMEIEINIDLLSIMLLHNLTSNFDNFSCAIKSRDKLPDVDALIIKIVEESECKSHKSDSDSSVMFSKHRFGKNKSSSQSDNVNSGNPSSNKSNLQCGYYKKKGHVTKNFFKNKNKNRDVNDANNVFLSAEINSASNSVYNVNDKQKWCLDSGCTTHLCNDSKRLTNLCEINSSVRLASDATAPGIAKGDVNIIASDGKSDSDITLQNTLHVPDLRTNLVSIAKIVDKDHQVIFSKTHASIKDANGVTKMIADRQFIFSA